MSQFIREELSVTQTVIMSQCHKCVTSVTQVGHVSQCHSSEKKGAWHKLSQCHKYVTMSQVRHNVTMSQMCHKWNTYSHNVIRPRRKKLDTNCRRRSDTAPTKDMTQTSTTYQIGTQMWPSLQCEELNAVCFDNVVTKLFICLLYGGLFISQVSHPSWNDPLQSNQFMSAKEKSLCQLSANKQNFYP